MCKKRPGLVNVSYTWYKSLNQLLLLLRKLPQLSFATRLQKRLLKRRTASVRTDFSSSNKRSAFSKEKNNDKNTFTAFFLPIVNEIQDHNIDLILENGQKWVEIDAV